MGTLSEVALALVLPGKPGTLGAHSFFRLAGLDPVSTVGRGSPRTTGRIKYVRNPPATPPWIPGVPGKTGYFVVWGGAGVVGARPRAGFKPAPTKVGEGGDGQGVGGYWHTSVTQNNAPVPLVICSFCSSVPYAIM